MAKKYKWAVDKKALTVDEYENELPAFYEEWSYLTNEDIDYQIAWAASKLLDAYVSREDIVSRGDIAIEKNHFRITLYCNDCVVRYWKSSEDRGFAELSFDIVDAIQGYEAFGGYLRKYPRTFSECVHI